MSDTDEIGTGTGRQRRVSSRRAFLGALGTSAATGIAFAGSAGAAEPLVVSMATNYFDPIGLSVDPGTTVRFEIETGSHSATAYEDRIPAGATGFDSGTISDGGFEHTFETPGTYDYYCIPHRSMGMVGRIVVGEPGGPAESSPIPDGTVPESELIVDQGTVSPGTVDGSDGGVGMQGGDGGMQDGGPGMMDRGPGMMGEGGPGWMMLVPVGFLTATVGVVGGAVYWAARRTGGETQRDASGTNPSTGQRSTDHADRATHSRPARPENETESE